MKRIIILFIALTTALSGYSQTYLAAGDTCFNKGDYVCAEEQYNKAFNLASGTDEQRVEIKLNRAKRCAIHLREADVEFAKKDYKKAHDNYDKVLVSNPKDEYAKKRRAQCDSILNPPVITLNISQFKLSFDKAGGSERVSVVTNASEYAIPDLPSWCTVDKYTNYFVVSCKSNTGQQRSDWFKVQAGDKTMKIDISQSGTVKKQEIALSVAKNELSFYSSGGTESISITTDASSYSVSLLPEWCTVQKYTDYFVVSCKLNAGQQRSDWFKVSADGKDVKIYVSQSGSAQPNAISKKGMKNKTSSYKRNKCFNCPKNKNWLGLSYGGVSRKFDQPIEDDDYVYSEKIKGMQLGIRFEPLFKGGFGLNTGIYYERYSTKLFESNQNDAYREDFFSAPLHLEYRFNFSKYFNIFVYGGASGHVRIRDTHDNRFQSSFDCGGGIRIGNFQVNVEQRVHKNKSKDMSLSLSYMF